MAIADRTAADLMGRDGKAKLASKVRLEAARAMGFEVAEPAEPKADAADNSDTPRKKKRTKAEPALPVKAVHFSNFIIQ